MIDEKDLFIPSIPYKDRSEKCGTREHFIWPTSVSRFESSLIILSDRDKVPSTLNTVRDGRSFVCSQPIQPRHLAHPAQVCLQRAEQAPDHYEPLQSPTTPPPDHVQSLHVPLMP